jgi:hypothetical protein
VCLCVGVLCARVGLYVWFVCGCWCFVCVFVFSRVCVCLCVGVFVRVYLCGIPPQPSHTETPTHIETRTHDKCGNTIEKSQAPDDEYINVRKLLSTKK